MILDLAVLDRDPEPIIADCVVVGGGIAGLVTASRLAEHGRHVVVLESGAANQIADVHPLNRVEQEEQTYAGAEHGRFRCLGGTSTRWGGAMLPFAPEDMQQHPAGWAPDWGIPYEQLLSHLPEIERRFRLPAGPFEDDAAIDAQAISGSFVHRFAKWPPFKLRNVAAAFSDVIESRRGPSIWLNATVTGWTLSDAGRLDDLSARAANGRALRVRAAHVVVAAGAIESTRLLLLIDRAADQRLFAPHDVLGRYLVDHLSAPIAELQPLDRYHFNEVVGFRFERQAMRNLRFEVRPGFREQQQLAAGFAHITFESLRPDGFEALRDIYRELQKRQQPARSDFLQVLRDLPWFVHAAWWRFVRSRLLYPPHGTFNVHLVTEQKPISSNRITLSHSQTDMFDTPIARINWRINDDDENMFARIANHFIDMWKLTSCTRLAQIKPFSESRWANALQGGGGIYHPAGTIRIGSDVTSGVVDDHLRCLRLSNVHVVSTATFPVVGGANPTLMLMLYARHVADEVDRDLARRGTHATVRDRRSVSGQSASGARQ